MKSHYYRENNYLIIVNVLLQTSHQKVAKIKNCDYFQNVNDFKAPNLRSEKSNSFVVTNRRDRKTVFSCFISMIVRCKQIYYLSLLRLIDVNIKI